MGILPVIHDIVKDLPRHAEKKYSLRAASFLRGIIVHHSAANDDPNVPDINEIAGIARYHVESKGWPGIGYHYVIDHDATIYKTNYISTLAYHAAGANKESIGICVMGDFREQPPTDAQLDALVALIDAIRIIHHSLYVVGHKDKTPTECPGQRLYDWLKEKYPG